MPSAKREGTKWAITSLHKNTQQLRTLSKDIKFSFFIRKSRLDTSISKPLPHLSHCNALATTWLLRDKP